MRKVKWGVLGVAKIATEKVIPAMQRGEISEIAAIASRDLHKAQAAAERLNIPDAYGSYEELLADPRIEAIYNPLPNEFHVPWTVRAMEAGKHVLCEKPVGLDAQEAKRSSRRGIAPGGWSRKPSWSAFTRNGVARASSRNPARSAWRRRSRLSSRIISSIRRTCGTARRAAAASTTSAAMRF